MYIYIEHPLQYADTIASVKIYLSPPIVSKTALELLVIALVSNTLISSLLIYYRIMILFSDYYLLFLAFVVPLPLLLL